MHGQVPLLKMYLLKAAILVWMTKIECCRIKEFFPPIAGRILRGHVIKTLYVPQEDNCEIHCYLDKLCQSINISPQLDNGKWMCELNDVAVGPESLIEAEKHKYYGTKNPCSSYPCVKNATCRPNFQVDNSFQCICPKGYTGEMYDKDVDECATGAHNCSHDASCINSDGSFVCFSEFGCKVDGATQLIKFKGYNHSCAANSCADVLINTPGSESGAYYLKTKEPQAALTYCHMEAISGCGGGGWTLVMKIDGAKTTFSYNASLWVNKIAHNQNSGKYGLDNQEAKMPSFWNNPFTKLCIGMRVLGEQITWILVNQEAVSLHALLSNNSYITTRVGRVAWKSLVRGSSLQNNCNMEGFNVVSPSGTRDPAITRIGIISNNEQDCSSCNSRIGFGSAGSRGDQDGSNSCGNEAGTYLADNEEKHIKATCYILVQ